MSATIYAVPQKFENTIPDIFQNQDKYQELEDKWLEDLKGWIIENFRGGKYIGRTIKFGVADAGMILVAKKDEKIILTADEDFSKECKYKQNLPTLHLKDLESLFLTVGCLK